MLAAQRGQQRGDRLAQPAPEARPLGRGLGQGDGVAEAVVGSGQGLELVGQADVLDQAQAPPQGDGTGVVVGQQVAGQGEQGGDPGAGGHEHELAVVESGHHRPPGRPPEDHLVADLEAGEVEREGPVRHGPHHELEAGGVGRVGQDAVRAAAEAAARELGFDPHELAGVEPEGLAVGHLEADPESPCRRERIERRDPGQALVAALPEPPVVDGLERRGLGVMRPASRGPPLEVARPETGSGLLARLPRDDSRPAYHCNILRHVTAKETGSKHPDRPARRGRRGTARRPRWPRTSGRPGSLCRAVPARVGGPSCG